MPFETGDRVVVLWRDGAWEVGTVESGTGKTIRVVPDDPDAYTPYRQGYYELERKGKRWYDPYGEETVKVKDTSSGDLHAYVGATIVGVSQRSGEHPIIMVRDVHGNVARLSAWHTPDAERPGFIYVDEEGQQV